MKCLQITYLFYSPLVSFQINELAIFTSFVIELYGKRSIYSEFSEVLMINHDELANHTCSKVLTRLHLRQALNALNSSGISAVMYSSSSIMIFALKR